MSFGRDGPPACCPDGFCYLLNASISRPKPHKLSTPFIGPKSWRDLWRRLVRNFCAFIQSQLIKRSSRCCALPPQVNITVRDSVRRIAEPRTDIARVKFPLAKREFSHNPALLAARLTVDRIEVLKQRERDGCFRSAVVERLVGEVYERTNDGRERVE